MKKILAVFLALVAPIASAQVVINPGGGGAASGSAVSGCATAGAVLYMDASALLACGAAPAPSYDATNIRLTVGTGSTTQQGIIVGYTGTSGYSGIWSSAVTPSVSNYLLRSNTASGNTEIGSATGALVGLSPGNNLKASISNGAGSGWTVTAGTATSDVHSLSTTQTWNAAGVTFVGHKYAITDTASAVGSLHSQWLGGAAGATNLMSLSKGGTATVPERYVSGDGTAALPAYALDGAVGDGTSGIFLDSSTYTGVSFSHGGTAIVGVASNGVRLKDVGQISFSANGIIMGTQDVFVTRSGAAALQVGVNTSGAAIAQTIKAHDVTGTDNGGANLTLAGGRGTGAGAGGNLIDQTAPSLGTGTTAQTLQDRTVLVAKAKALTAAAATNVVLINVASGAFGGGEMEYTVQASDGTDHQARSGRIQWAVVNKAGTETCTVSGASEVADSSTVAVSSGTLTYAITADTSAANGCYIAFNAVSSLVETTLNIAYRITANGGTSTFTAQ